MSCGHWLALYANKIGTASRYCSLYVRAIRQAQTDAHLSLSLLLSPNVNTRHRAPNWAVSRCICIARKCNLVVYSIYIPNIAPYVYPRAVGTQGNKKKKKKKVSMQKKRRQLGARGSRSMM